MTLYEATYNSHLGSFDTRFSYLASELDIYKMLDNAYKIKLNSSSGPCIQKPYLQHQSTPIGRST